MKNLKFLVVAIAALSMFSCSKESHDGDEDINGNDKTVVFSLAGGEMLGRAIESGHSAETAPGYTSVTMIAKNSQGATTNEYFYDEATTPEYWRDMKAGKTVKITVSNAATKMEAYCNEKFLTGTNVNNYQDFNNVPLIMVADKVFKGAGAASDVTGTGTAVNPYTFTVQLTPGMARIETYGSIPVTVAEHNLFAVDVEAVYINNIKLKFGDANLHFNTSDLPKWNVAYAVGGSCNMLFDNITGASREAYQTLPVPHEFSIAKTKAAAYNFYPQKTTQMAKEQIGLEMPHIILKVKAYLTEATYKLGTSIADMNYITIRTFKDGAMSTDGPVGNYIKNFEAGMIYRLNLADLAHYFEGNENPIDPNPEMDKVSITIGADIVSWKIQNMTPEL